MTSSTTETKRPTHTVWQVVGEGEISRWIRVGAAWTNRDGKGLFVKFDAYPVLGRIIVREVSDKSGIRESED